MFILTEEQMRLKNEIREFVDREVRPAAAEYDRSGAFPAEIIKRINALGYSRLPFDQALGGLGRDMIESVIFLEEISRGIGSLGFTMAAHMMQCCYALADGVSEWQREAWLKPAISCEKLLAFALSEESGGSDVLGVSTIAIQKGKGWLLNGSKCWTTNVGVADGYIVCARTSAHSRSRSVSLFYVDADSEGLEICERDKMLGLNNSPTGTIRFKNCRLPSEALIGDENEGYPLIKKGLNYGRLALSATAVGIAQEAMELAARFSAERGSFDRVISSYQGVSFPIAEMHTHITVARNMLYHVASLINAGMRASTEIAALKLFSSEMCQEVCRQSLMLHGGRGYHKSFAVERLLRDSLALTIAEGTSQICKVIISNAIYNALPDKG